MIMTMAIFSIQCGCTRIYQLYCNCCYHAIVFAHLLTINNYLMTGDMHILIVVDNRSNTYY